MGYGRKKGFERKAAGFLAGTGLCLFLGGCAGSSGQTENEQVTIKVWESLEVKDYIEAAGRAYHELHPEITVVYENVELDNTSPQIILDGPAGAGADLFAAPCDKMGELVDGGYVTAVTDDGFVKDAVLPSCLSAASYKNTVYGYPVSDETYALYYNKALIDGAEVPRTWEDMIAYAAAHSEDGNYGFIMDPTTGYYTIIFTTGEGNRLFGADGTDGSQTYLNTPAAVKGMGLLGELSEALDISSSDLNTQIADELFATGKAAMEISGPWNASVFQEAGIDYGVTTLPSLPGEETPAVSFSGARLMFVSAYSAHQAEAAEFAEFLLSEEMQRMRYDYLKCIPAVEIDLEDEAIQGFMEQLEYAAPMPGIPQMTSFWDSMGAAGKNIWDGADAQSTMDKCDKAILKSTKE